MMAYRWQQGERLAFAEYVIRNRELLTYDVMGAAWVKVTGYTHIDPPPNKNQAIAAVRDIERLRADHAEPGTEKHRKSRR